MIPDEIREFFNKEGGHSLLIKGEPGSGKTTLALEILDEFRTNTGVGVLYVSTRVADNALLREFPWITGVLKKKLAVSEKKIERKNLNRLEGLIEDGFTKERVQISEDEAIIEVGELLPEMEKIYKFIEQENGKKSIICIDSIDGLSEKYGIPADKILYTIQKDIVETGVANVIFILEETTTAKIDYLGDGIVVLQHETYGKFWKRVLLIKKLRGSAIKRPRYLYTLKDGRFSIISYHKFSLDEETPDMSSLKSLIEIFKDTGCLNVLISADFPKELVQAIILTLIDTATGNTMVLPPAFYPSDSLKNHASKIISKDVKIIGYGSDRQEIYLEGRDILVELSTDIVKYHGGKHATIIVGVDSVANIYGDVRDLPTLIKNMKEGHRIALITPEQYNVGGGVDYEIKLSKIEDIPVLIKDMAYGIHLHDKNSALELVPLL